MREAVEAAQAENPLDPMDAARQRGLRDSELASRLRDVLMARHRGEMREMSPVEFHSEKA
jgi:hypothetical protein